MKITSSYGVEIRKADGALSTNLKIYREAVRVLAMFYDSVWEKVPAVRRRSSCVHADLVRLSAVMRENGRTA